MIHIDHQLKDFFHQAYTDEGDRVRNRVIYGGRAGGKTQNIAGFLVALASQYKIRVLCTRQIQARIADSSKAVIEAMIYGFEMQHEFDIKETTIVHKHTGSEFLFLGLMRNTMEIKGLEGISICWIEEAHALQEAQWNILSPTLRTEWSQFIISFNPDLASDWAYKYFVLSPPRGTIVKKINYTDNKYLSQTIRDVIDAAREADYELYKHIYLGEPLADDEMSIIKRKWLDAAIDGHKALGIDISGSRVTGFDVADAGEDACAYVDVHGVLAYNSDLWKAGEDELKRSATRVYARAREIGSEIVYDAIGVGAHVGSDINDLNTENRTRVQHSKFFAGSGVYKPDAIYGETGITNKDYFSNVKSQAWWMIADRLRNTYNAVRNGAKYDVEDMLFIASDMPNLEKLKDELTTPRKDFDASGKVKVESKKDLAKPNREGGAQPSPNLADAFVMANVAPYVRSRSWFG